MNGNIDYKLGEMTQSITDLRNDVSEIKVIVRDLNIWRWKLVGATGAITVIGNLAVNVLIKYINSTH